MYTPPVCVCVCVCGSDFEGEVKHAAACGVGGSGVGGAGMADCGGRRGGSQGIGEGGEEETRAGSNQQFEKKGQNQKKGSKSEKNSQIKKKTTKIMISKPPKASETLRNSRVPKLQNLLKQKF